MFSLSKALDITRKDLIQLVRDRMVFIFLLIMPVILTLLFGFAFGAFEKAGDPRLPVGLLDQDQSWISLELVAQLEKSEVIHLEWINMLDSAGLEKSVVDEKLAAALVIPSGYGSELAHGRERRLILYADTDLSAGRSVESDVLAAVLRLDSALRTALLLEQAASGPISFDYTFEQAIQAWEDPPVRVERIESAALAASVHSNTAFTNTSPGFMLQFALASLLTSAQLLVQERRSRSLQRLLTTSVSRLSILLGHFLAILFPILLEFLILLTFSQLLLGVDYSRAPLAVLLVAVAAALCIAALGLLIGIFARTGQQAVIFSLVPMFLLTAIGGGWVPLEVTGEAFRIVGHLSPVAWALDGFKNISVRGLGLESVLLPVAALLGYAVLFFLLAGWKFARLQES